MDTYDILEYIWQPGGSSVLATVIAVEGHAYRREGAAMVLYPSGESAGIISPGCLEDDLAARVPGVLESGQPAFVEYDMRPEEDLIWGAAVGCGGRITILLEPLEGKLLQLLLEARRRTKAGGSVVLERRLTGVGVAYRLFPVPERSRPGTLRNRETEPAGAWSGQGELLYIAEFYPRPRLIVFGAGRDTPPLCSIAARIGFRVVVADWREGLLSPERFPTVSERVFGTPGELAAKLAVGPTDFAVVCSHQLRHDRDMLALLLPAGPAYIGVMGSRKRISLLFEGLEMTSNVHAPIGLDIGADGPEEIAVSIAAELIVRKAAIAAAGKEMRANDDRRLVFGRGTGQPDGQT